MNKNVKRWRRVSEMSLAMNQDDPHGRLFLSPKFPMMDLSSLVVLHSGIDTVKQLFRGQIRPSVLSEVERIYGEGFGECIELGGVLWLVGSGGASGYQYRLQNSDIGLIVFLKSRYSEKDQDFSHLKIECSPHWLIGRKTSAMREDLFKLADVFIEGSQPAGCATHICVDIQGWQPDDRLERDLISHAKRVRTHNSAKVVYMDMGEVAIKHDVGQSYLWGSASSVQLAIYRKDIQAKAVDKYDFWRTVWNRVPGESFDLPAYDPAKPVWRIELRFHHSVLAEFGNGEYASSLVDLPSGAKALVGCDPRRSIAHIEGVGRRLKGLWLYGLDLFRYEMHETGAGRYIHPVWQWLEDVGFHEPTLTVTFKRVRKEPGEGNGRSVGLALGNWLSIMARNRVEARAAFECLKLSGIYDDIYNHFQRRAFADFRPFQESEIFDFIEKGLRRRTLLGKAA